jgi:hypothetical protein
MAIEFTLENVLAVVIALITLNLLFIGFYIVSVLREVKKTVHRAGAVIDEVDQTVKDGIEKAKAMNAPLQALATTATAFGGIIKTGDAIRKATQSILGGGTPAEIEGRGEVVAQVEIEKPKVKSMKITEKTLNIEKEIEPEDVEVKIEAEKKKIYRKPRFFKKK